ncbi:MAG TPA: PAS domain-containing protein, partial [Jatrophihabitans sp.]|nr:PAS domain-containing protein [Jatrophihabitans sp.]
MTELLPASTNGRAHKTTPPRGTRPARRPVASDAEALPVADLAAMRSVLDDLPMRVMLCDLNLTITYVNKATVEGLGRLAEHLPIEVEDIVGANIDIFHKDPAHQRNVLSSDANLPVRSIIKVGPETLDLSVQAVYDEDDAFVGAMATWEVITDRLKLEAEKEEATADTSAVNQLLQVITGARSAAEVAQLAVDTVRAQFGWAYGSYWEVEDDDALHFRVESGDAGPEFRAVTLAASFKEGVGLSGRAWRTRDLY